MLAHLLVPIVVQFQINQVLFPNVVRVQLLLLENLILGSREFNFGYATGALASTSTATALGSSEGAVASATLGTSTAISDIGLAYGWFLILFPISTLLAIAMRVIVHFLLTEFLPRSAAISAVISACIALYGVLQLLLCLFSGVCGRPIYF